MTVCDLYFSRFRSKQKKGNGEYESRWAYLSRYLVRSFFAFAVQTTCRPIVLRPALVVLPAQAWILTQNPLLKSTCVSGWVVSGLGESRAKITREAFKPKLKRSTGLLTNPSLDEAFYLRLKDLKSSSASKANVDPLEKVYRNQTF